MWSLDEAIALVRKIQPALHAVQWHVALGGGVLNAGRSDKDLDLYLMPFGKGDEIDVLPMVESWFGASDDIGREDYDEPPMWEYRKKFHVESKRIDVFIGVRS